MSLLFIDWHPSEVIFSVGVLSVRWYALGWLGGVFIAYLLAAWIYRREGIDPALDRKGCRVPTGKFEPLVIYCFVGMLVGARLGHCLFYEPGYYLMSLRGVLEMLLPIGIAPDSWAITFKGYAGLASHGGVVGLIAALLLYVRRTGLPVWWVLDVIGVVAAAPSCCIRLGNLMNSEIVGKPTSLPWGFLFHLPEDLSAYGHYIPRHPAQLYEAIAYLAILLVSIVVYTRGNPGSATLGRAKVGTGFFFGLCLASIFTFRFFVEFLKEVQGGADDGSTALDMGQMLSLPFVALGLWCMLCSPGAKRPAAR